MLPPFCNAGTTFAAAWGVLDEIVPATEGTGPLLQRDYWAVLDDCPARPSEVMDHLRRHFCELPPASLVKFEAPDGLRLGAELDIAITAAPRCRVRVVHESPQSLTFATLDGHPEAGRITFGAYRNDAGDVVFHIRSRARSATAFHLLGFLTLGEAMQTNTWTDLITFTAASLGATIRDVIHATTEHVDEMPEDASVHSPTFLATGN